MSLLVDCPRCGASYARFLLPEEPRCRCGAPLTLEGSAPCFVDREDLLDEEAKLRELTRLADRVSFLIVATDLPRIDVDIERAQLRQRCQTLFPDKMDLFEMIYASRFERLWQQFREVGRE